MSSEYLSDDADLSALAPGERAEFVNALTVTRLDKADETYNVSSHAGGDGTFNRTEIRQLAELAGYEVNGEDADLPALDPGERTEFEESMTVTRLGELDDTYTVASYAGGGASLSRIQIRQVVELAGFEVTETGSADKRTGTPSRRDLARVGYRLGDRETNGRLFGVCLDALASAPHDFGSDEHIQFVAGQIYDEASERDVDDAETFVERFREVYSLDTKNDASDLQGRASREKENYRGQLAFVNVEGGE